MSLKYPVLLVHGMGFRDYKKICYWGRIPRMLEEKGCQVFFGNQDSNADIETNGNHLARRILEILEETGAEKFNAEHPEPEEVFCQSYAFIMKKPSSDIFMFITNAFVYMFDGENDGLLAPDSAKWGEFKGIYRGVGNRGISHCDEVDMRRKRFSKKQGDGIADILDLYRDIVSDLKKRDF